MSYVVVTHFGARRLKVQHLDGAVARGVIFQLVFLLDVGCYFGGFPPSIQIPAGARPGYPLGTLLTQNLMLGCLLFTSFFSFSRSAFILEIGDPGSRSRRASSISLRLDSITTLFFFALTQPSGPSNLALEHEVRGTLRAPSGTWAAALRKVYRLGEEMKS